MKSPLCSLEGGPSTHRKMAPGVHGAIYFSSFIQLREFFFPTHSFPTIYFSSLGLETGPEVAPKHSSGLADAVSVGKGEAGFGSQLLRLWLTSHKMKVHKT